jgi:uncharacterized protein
MVDFRPERFELNDYSAQAVSICGKALVADQSGALYWPGQKALIIADLHFEKGSSFAAKGQMLPPYDTRQTLFKLAAAIDKYEAETVVALGDSLHDSGALDRMNADDRDVLRIMQDDRRWIWVTGNHDPDIPGDLGGEVRDEVRIDGLTLRHTPSATRVTHEIAGHMHPAAKLAVHGNSIRRPCFVGNGLRLVLPAFGAFTGGLNIMDDAFVPLFGSDGLSVWMLGEEGLYPVASRQLRGD